MTKTIISDFSRVLLFPKDHAYEGGLNALNSELSAKNPAYDFLDTFELNEHLLAYYSGLNETTPVHIFTSETIQDHPAIRQTVLDAVTSVLGAKKLGVHKSEASAYNKVLEAVSAKPSEVIYIDDKQTNLDVAKKLGIATILHAENDTTIEQLNTFLGVSR